MDAPERTIDTAILGAVIKEIEPLCGVLNDLHSFELRGQSFFSGIYAGRRLLVGATGIGKVNAAITTSALLERFSVSRVCNMGCAGAYAEGPLQVGDVLLTDDSLLGDEGILGEGGPQSSREIGIPILVHNGKQFFDSIPLDEHLEGQGIRGKIPSGWRYSTGGPAPEAEWVIESDDRARKNEERFRIVYGPSLTVGMASADLATASKRFSHYGAFAENMEGSAVAQACFRFGVPVIECRGMSNIAGNRSKAHWRLEEAISHCNAIILGWLAQSRI